jgi:hypothetical protein
MVVCLLRLVVEQAARVAIKGGRHASSRGDEQNVLGDNKISLGCNATKPAGGRVGQVDVDIAAAVVAPELLPRVGV